MVEVHRDSTGRREYGHAIAIDDRAGAVHLESPTAVEFDGEDPEWLRRQKRFQHILEVFLRHVPPSILTVPEMDCNRNLQLPTV